MKTRISFALFFLLALPISAPAAEWHVDTGADNLVKFTSEVVVLTFDGVTDAIDGYLYWEGEEVSVKNSQLYFEVDLNTLKTGIGKRDRDMREVLETRKWPFATFQGKITAVQKMDTVSTADRVTCVGEMFIHGVKRPLEVEGILTIEKDGRMRVRSEFTIRLSDFQIAAPSLAAFVKVSNEIRLHLDVYLKKVDEGS